MTKEAAQALYNLGRAHALPGNHLYAAALDYAVDEGIPDPDHFAFNGTFSLSTYYLLGLGIELLLKTAYVASGGQSEDRHLREAIGHDLKRPSSTLKVKDFRAMRRGLWTLLRQ